MCTSAQRLETPWFSCAIHPRGRVVRTCTATASTNKHFPALPKSRYMCCKCWIHAATCSSRNTLRSNKQRTYSHRKLLPTNGPVSAGSRSHSVLLVCFGFPLSTQAHRECPFVGLRLLDSDRFSNVMLNLFCIQAPWVALCFLWSL